MAVERLPPGLLPGSSSPVKGVDKTYQWGVEGQRKCPPKCSAKMSLGYAAMVSDDGVVDAMRTCRVGGLSASRYLLTVARWMTQLPCYSSDGHTPALRLLYCLPACLLEKGRLPRRNGRLAGFAPAVGNRVMSGSFGTVCAELGEGRRPRPGRMVRTGTAAGNGRI